MRTVHTVHRRALHTLVWCVQDLPLLNMLHVELTFTAMLGLAR